MECYLEMYTICVRLSDALLFILFAVTYIHGVTVTSFRMQQ